MPKLSSLKSDLQTKNHLNLSPQDVIFRRGLQPPMAYYNFPNGIFGYSNSMPEGDTLFRTAATLRKALAGKTITRFETSLNDIAVVNARTPVKGRTVFAVEARGKNLLIVLRLPASEREDLASEPISTPPAIALDLLRTDLVLHSHLRMTGSWHLYRPGEAWQKPAHYAKTVLYTDEFTAPCFSAPIVELMTARSVTRHPQLTTLGPDTMTDSFDSQQAALLLRQYSDLEIGVAIMKQRALSGVGNIYKSETLFMQRLSPFLKVNDLSDSALDALIQRAHELLQRNGSGGPRRTYSGLNTAQLLWVYGRSGEPCRVCGQRIQMRRQGIDARSTYYCPHCQQTIL